MEQIKSDHINRKITITGVFIYKYLVNGAFELLLYKATFTKLYYVYEF